MSNYPNSPLASRPYGHGANGTELHKINMFMNPCEFLDSLCMDANRLGAVLTASDQSIGNQQDRPWNAVDGSFNPRDKECRPQWQLLLWFIKETDANYQKLQSSSGQNMPPDMVTWLTIYHQSRDVRKAGLRTLADIVQGNTPINFNEVLCAIIVLHAILDSASKRNLFEGDVESSLNGWSYVNSLARVNREIIGFILKRLASSPARLREPPGAHVSGTGSMFAEDALRPLSIVVSDTSLSEMPPYGYNTGAPSLSSHLNNVSFLSQSGYSESQSFNQPQATDPYHPWGSETSSLPNSSIMEMDYSFQSNVGAYSQPSPGQLYGPSQSSGYIPHARTPDMVDLGRSTPLFCFMGFLDEFMALGDLHHLFSHGIDSVHRTHLPRTYNARASESEFQINAERSLFGPLKSLSSLQDPLIQAIISTTQSLALLGGLSTFTSMACYMIHLGMNMLETRTPCLNFSRMVLQQLQRCPGASTMDLINHLSRSWRLTQNQPLDQFIDEIGRRHSGVYHPRHLVQSPNARPRNHRSIHARESTMPSRASSSRHTPSAVDLSTSNRQSRLDNTDMSVASELTTNTTPSTISTARCKECGKPFQGKNLSSHLSRHKRSHRVADSIRCPCGCPRVFKGSRTDNIRAHCRKVHNEELPPDFWSARTLSSEP
ncbi:hypothetical protein F5Y05DRAFT_122135 [Hypoxylon sp. FL0543]|nr:hypothetical protein F5Y05DRAFT_122135 [Hypoxylon sp. FL0543]